MPDLDALLGRVRDLSQAYLAGGFDAFEPFRELVGLLLSLTVMDPSGGVRLYTLEGGLNRRLLSGWAPTQPVPLTDGRYLRLSVSLYIDYSEKAQRDVMKVGNASAQYQADGAGDRWIFRYDYLREQGEHPHPQSHVQVRGRLEEADVLPQHHPLERVHFPTGRFSIESVIRLLIEQFSVTTNEEAGI